LQESRDTRAIHATDAYTLGKGHRLFSYTRLG